MKLVERTLQVDAPADPLYELLTDAEHLARWMAATAEVDAEQRDRGPDALAAERVPTAAALGLS